MTRNSSQIHPTDHRSVSADRTSIQVSMTPRLKTFVEDAIRQTGHSTKSEFIRDAIRQKLRELGLNIDGLKEGGRTIG